jgi:type III secretion system FlhB-like substrate exporter
MERMVDTLKEIDFFENLPQEIIKKIAEISVLITAKKGQTLFTKNTRATGFYILKKVV